MWWFSDFACFSQQALKPFKISHLHYLVIYEYQPIKIMILHTFRENPPFRVFHYEDLTERQVWQTGIILAFMWDSRSLLCMTFFFLWVSFCIFVLDISPCLNFFVCFLTTPHPHPPSLLWWSVPKGILLDEIGTVLSQLIELSSRALLCINFVCWSCMWQK